MQVVKEYDKFTITWDVDSQEDIDYIERFEETLELAPIE